MVVIADSIAYAYKVYEGRSAFLRWQPQILELMDGVDIHRAHAYPNPPIMALTLFPLAALPPPLGAMLFYFSKVVLAGWTLVLSLRLARGARSPLLAWAIGLTLLLALRPLHEDLQHGNVNIVVTAVAIGGLYAWSLGRDRLCGLSLGLAAAFKVTPGLIIVYLAYKRQWAAVAWSGAGLVLFLLLVPGLALGWELNLQCLTSWFEGYVAPYAIEGRVRATSQLNQSLPGLFFRLLTDVPGLRIGDAARPVNLVTLDPDSVRLLVRAVAVGVVGWLAWLCRGRVADRTDWRLAVEFSLVLVAMLLLSERSWKAHYTVMLLPYAVLVADLVRAEVGHRRRSIGVLAAAFVLMLCTSSEVAGWLYVEDGHLAGHKLAEAYGSFAASAVVVFAALSGLQLRSRR